MEAVQAFTNVTVFYEPYTVHQSAHLQKKDLSPYEWVKNYIETLLEEKWQEGVQSKRRIVDIPVCYGGEVGPDLEEVARINRLTPEEVVRIHTAGTYLVYMIGFAPGFPFLGGLSEKIAPRAGKHRECPFQKDLSALRESRPTFTPFPHPAAGGSLDKPQRHSFTQTRKSQVY